MVEIYCRTDGDRYAPTLRPYGAFNPESDCNTLREAMHGAGTDEEALIRILTKRSSLQRAELVRKYKSMFGKDLSERIKSDTTKHFETVLTGLCSTLAEFDARELNWALKGAGTNEKALIEILCTRTPEQLAILKRTYAALFEGRDLEKEVADDTSGDLRNILVAILQGDRDRSSEIDITRARDDAQELFEAGENRWGTDESREYPNITGKLKTLLEELVIEYRLIAQAQLRMKISNKTIVEAIESEMSGDLREAYLAIAKSAMNKPRYFAEQLVKSMKGAGTDDRTLIRIILSRAEIDMQLIKNAFLLETDKTLEDWIADDVSGDYKNCLLSLVGH